MAGGERAKLLCSFGGDFMSQHGKLVYVGGKTRLVSIDRSASFRSLLLKMSEMCHVDPRCLEVRFQLPEGGLDSRLVSVETDEDVRNMMEEFQANMKIPIFLFSFKNQWSEDEEIAAEENDNPTLLAADNEGRREELMVVEEPFDSESGPSTSETSPRRDYVRPSSVEWSLSEGVFWKDSQSLVVGQEYEDVQMFRNALTSAAIAANFELYMVRSDQRRVTARCAAEGCTWRIHASKLPRVSTFRIRTLTPEHTCVRSADAGHRQATAKWIASCIREKIKRDQNYKPRQIINDIYREYGVLITYKRAFLGREKALEELRTEQKTDVLPIENDNESKMEKDNESFMENGNEEMQTSGEIHDPPRKKRAHRSIESKGARPLHCTLCNQSGHNRRTCRVQEDIQGETS